MTDGGGYGDDGEGRGVLVVVVGGGLAVMDGGENLPRRLCEYFLPPLYPENRAA